MPTIEAERLYELSRTMVATMGSEAAEAAEVADHLVRANLAGHDSHGVGMLPTYVDIHAQGLLVCNQTLQTSADAGALLVLDAGRGFGQRMAAEAVRRGIARAREQGACVVALRNSSHIGRIGTYGEQAAAAGMAFVGFVNVADHAPWTATWGAGDARLGTNPFCAAVPDLASQAGSADADPSEAAALVLDMATSAIAFGKARVARNKGVPVPEGALIDQAGLPTTDPLPIVDEHKGALLAFGKHKGSGLAIMCEILGGALLGAPTIVHTHHGGVVNSMLGILVDPSRMGEPAALGREVEAVKDHLRRPPVAPGFAGILLPGEPERRSRAARLEGGIPIDEKSLSDILDAGARLGLDRAELARPLAG